MDGTQHTQDRARRQHDSGWTLIEVLIAGSIGVIITGMLIVVWLAISSSWTVTARGSEARDYARDAVARMSREIRDMEPRIGEVTAVSIAEPFKLRFSTTFNLTGNQSGGAAPVLTEYEYVTTADGEGILYRRRDIEPDGDIDGQDSDRIVARNLLNTTDQPLFTYTYVDENGDRATIPPVLLDSIVVTTIRVVVDMQPGKAPQPMDLVTTVQLRNQQ